MIKSGSGALAAERVALATVSVPSFCRVPVRVQPRAKRPGVQGFRADGVLLVRVAAPPEDGRANAELCALIAKAAGLRARHVDVVIGHTSRDKVVQIEGHTEAQARALIAAAAAI